MLVMSLSSIPLIPQRTGSPPTPHPPITQLNFARNWSAYTGVISDCPSLHGTVRTLKVCTMCAVLYVCSSTVIGSLFTDETKSWNVAHLPSTLSRLLPSSDKGLPGVNTPYLYFGMWRATFAWHVEDMDLFSINYVHFGAPKFWYAVPQGRACALEQTMRSKVFSFVCSVLVLMCDKVTSLRIPLLAPSFCGISLSWHHQPTSQIILVDLIS